MIFIIMKKTLQMLLIMLAVIQRKQSTELHDCIIVLSEVLSVFF